jgi:hypothetical protein
MKSTASMMYSTSTLGIQKVMESLTCPGSTTCERSVREGVVRGVGGKDVRTNEGRGRGREKRR